MLNTERAVDMGVYVVRVFVRLREVIAASRELALRLDDLEYTAELISLKHDTFEHNTRMQLKLIFDALRKLMAPPEAPGQRPIGLVTTHDAPSKPKAAKARNMSSSFSRSQSSRPREPAREQRVGGGFSF